jgi:hypothetical protein
MPILTVRLAADEERLLTKRSRDAGMKKAASARPPTREEPFLTGDAIVKGARGRWAMRRCGHAKLCEAASVSAKH